MSAQTNTAEDTQNNKLTLGPVLFHWDGDKWRDFYFKIADEAPVDTVYIGEVICSKRTPFIEKHYDEVATRLTKAGKTVVFSTLSEIMLKRDRKIVKDISDRTDYPVEANDASALYHLKGRPHRVGPLLNVYNEDAMMHLAQNGAVHVTLAPELPAEALAVFGETAQMLGVGLEVQVYGRMGLALSARCYHARAHGRRKDTCRFVCGEDPDGMDLKTLKDKPFLTINGIQTMSYTCLNLIQELPALQKAGISHFRLSPHDHDMVAIADLFHGVLNQEFLASEALKIMEEIGLNVPFSNGFYHGLKGYDWYDDAEAIARTA